MQNPFTMKHTTGQMPSQNSSKITMIEMVDLAPQKKSPERILHSAKKGKTNIPPRKPKNDTTPTVTIEMYNNLNVHSIKKTMKRHILQRNTKRNKRKSQLR